MRSVRMTKLTQLIAAMAAVVVLPVNIASKALAWGDDGHMTVALVAQHYLTASAKDKLDALLQADNDPLTDKDIASRATWADRYRDTDRFTTQIHYQGSRNGHFVDTELADPNIDV